MKTFDYVFDLWKGQIWHISCEIHEDKGTGCRPWSQKSAIFPVQSHLPSVKAWSYISSPSPTLIIYPDSAIDSIEFQRHWIHWSGKCAPKTVALQPAEIKGFCFSNRLSARAGTSRAEAHWSSCRAVQMAWKKRHVWWISWNSI